MSRHPRWNPDLASPRNLRIGTLVLLLIMVNQINDPLVDASLGQSLLYWGFRPVVLAFGLLLADLAVCRYLIDRLEYPAWLKPVMVVTALGLVPLALTEAALEQYLPFQPEFLDDELWAISPVLALLGEYATLATLVIPIHFLLWLVIDKGGIGGDGEAKTSARPDPEFLQRAPNLAVDAVLALHAEEHYVRVYTADGAELIHYRFGDAVDEMPAELGLQVHRSWWVADSAVSSAKRGARRWQLELGIDTAVPVSDSYVQSVRERGWLKRKPKLR